MEPAQQQYYQYLDESEKADSFVIVDTNDNEIRLTEKIGGNWKKPFWMPQSEFENLTTIQHVGNLTSDQYLRVCEASGGVYQNA